MPMMNYSTYFEDTEVANAAHPFGDRYDGWVITSELWESFGQGIVLPINPERLSVSAPLRGHEYEAAFGKAAYSGFNKRKRTHFDVFNLALTFNSGYIVPKLDVAKIKARTGTSDPLAGDNAADMEAAINSAVSGYLSNEAQIAQDLKSRFPKPDIAQEISRAYPRNNRNGTAELYSSLNPPATGNDRYVPLRSLGINAGLYDGYIPPGTQNLYGLIALLDGPKTWRPNLNYSDPFSLSAPNRIKVYSNSLVFPSMVFYCLAVDQGISWSESAENPTSFDTTINLLVTMTDPLWGRAHLSGLVDSYKSNFTIGTLSRFLARDRSTYRSSAPSNGSEF